MPVPKVTAVSLAPKRKAAADDEVLLMTTVPSEVAVSASMVCVVPFKSTVAVSVVKSSGLMVRPATEAAKVSVAALATGVAPTAMVDVKLVAESMVRIELPAGTLVPVNDCPGRSPAVDPTV